MIFNNIITRKIKDTPLKIKLVITYILLTAIPMAIIGYITYKENTKAIEEQVGEYIPRLLHQANINIENELLQLNELPEAISNSSDIMAILRSNPYKDKSQYLKDQYTIESFLAKTYLDSKSSEIIGAFLLTNKGNYSSVKIPYTGFDLNKSKIPFGEMHELSGTSQIVLPNEITLSFQDNSNFILLVNEIKDVENRKSLGTLALAVKVSFIEDILKDIDKEEKATIWVMDQNGYIIFHPKESLIGTVDQEITSYPLVNGSFRTTYSNKKNILYSLNQSEENRWILVHSIPMQYLTERTDAVRNVTIIIFLLLIIATTILSVFTAWSVTKPLQTLSKVMKKVEKGNLHISIPPGNKDEVGVLADTFQSMLNQLRQLIKENYENELKQRDAKIYALQSQINPHFMYNTLETIGAVIEEEESELALEMVVILGEMLRYSLSEGKRLVPLQVEINHIKNYLTLQKIRFEDRVHFFFEGEDLIGKYYSPKFIIQPIVENSFKYGMSSRKVLSISIKFEIQQNTLHITVSDNGPGIDNSRMVEIQQSLNETDYFSKESGLGLVNVNARIKMLFNENYGLSLQSEKGEGTTINISIPLIEGECLNKYQSLEER